MKALITSQSMSARSVDVVPELSKGQQEALKWLAIVTMTIDHVNKILFQYNYPLLLWIGRLAFPLFVFLIAYNLVVRKVKPTRYLWPLFIFALGTQPIYMWAFQDTSGNIFFTLSLGVLYMGLQDLLRQRLRAWLSHLLLVIIFFIPSLQVAYGPMGVFFIPVLGYFLKRPTLALYGWLCGYLTLVNAVTTTTVVAFFVSPTHGLFSLSSSLGLYTLVPLLLLPLVFFVSHLPITLARSNPWFFYLFYPAHLLVLKLLIVYL